MGTEAFWVPAAIAAAGAGTQYVNTKNANNRAQESEAGNIRDQQALQAKGAQGARALTAKIASDDPQQLARKATGDYVAQLRKNAAGSASGGDTSTNRNQFGASSSSLAPVTGANSRYTADTAKSQAEVGKYGDTLATEMGGIDAPVLQRQNEGLGMNSYATGLQGLNLQSLGTNFVNSLRTQAAGQPNPYVSLFANMAQNFGTSKAGGALFGKAAPAAGGTFGDGTVSGFSPTAANPSALKGFSTNIWNL